MLCRQGTSSSVFVDWWLQVARATQLLSTESAGSSRQHAETLAEQGGANPLA